MHAAQVRNHGSGRDVAVLLIQSSRQRGGTDGCQSPPTHPHTHPQLLLLELDGGDRSMSDELLHTTFLLPASLFSKVTFNQPGGRPRASQAGGAAAEPSWRRLPGAPGTTEQNT